LPAPASPPTAAWFFAALFLAGALWIYGEVIRRIRADGGKVRAADFNLPELLMSLVFASFFGAMMFESIQRQTKGGSEVSIDAVLPSSFLFVAFSIGILAFLHFARRLNPGHVFGLDRVSPLAALGWSCGLLLAAFPLCGAANALTMLALQGKLEPQPLVELFSEVAQAHDYSAITKIFISGVLIQPACEELLFRGFFYGVWKRYLGGLAAGVCACLLFAAFHTSLTAFAGLFVLAACLNLAYERTGSLLVPIGMHALFNFTSLLVIYLQAQLPAALQ
jgi:membrane protease YdiL (CAAX protease family)